MTQTDRTDGQRAQRLAVAITAANLLVFGAAWVGDGGAHPLPSPVALVALVLAYALVGSAPMRLYFSQHRAAFSLADAVVVAGLYFASPAWLGLITCVGELLYYLPRRTPLVKTAFNCSAHAATAVVAAIVFSILGGHHSAGPSSWPAALAAAASASLLNFLVMSAVISRAEGAPMRRTLADSLPTAALMTILAAPVGLLVVELLRSGPLSILLLLPVTAGITFNSRYAGLQRDEHLRVERLYESTSRSAQLSEDLDVLSSITEESRLLVTGTASICIVREGPESPWEGRTARARGVGGTRESDVEDVLAQAGSWDGSTLVVPVPERLRGLAPAADVMLVARSPGGSPVELVLAVLRERSGGERVETGVGETLAAFAAHGAVMAANASLIRKLQSALAAQLESNRRKDEFVATISHELRTPLTVMLGAAQTLSRLDDRLDASDRERLLGTAVDQGQRLKLLIEDLLLVAAAEKEEKRTCHLLPVDTRELENDFRQDVPDTRAGLVRIVNRAPGVEVLTERFKARQVVANLVQNGLKYGAGSPVEVTVAEAGPTVVINVVDHGPGIPEEDRERVFERFLQLDQSSTRSQGGTGLGLYICRKLADQLDARLELRETPGGGCTFVLSLPRRPLRRAGDLTAVPSRSASPASQSSPSALSPAPPPPAVAGMLRRPVVVPIGGTPTPKQAKEISL